MTDDCLFCAIVAGSIPSAKVLDRDDVYAFRDIAPAAPTHVLVVPKKHIGGVSDITRTDGRLLVKMIDAARAAAVAEGVDESGYRLVMNVGPDAGQTVVHLHMHLLGGRPLGPVAS